MTITINLPADVADTACCPTVFCPNTVGLCYNHAMTTISIDDMRRDLAGYLHRVQAGETLLVLEADQPLAEIKPFRDFAVGVGEPRLFGLCAGEFVVPDEFDAPLPEDVLQDFEKPQDYQ